MSKEKRLEEILDIAKETISGPRYEQYGDPIKSFQDIAKRWNHFLHKRGILEKTTNITSAEVVFMLVEFKMERECNNHKKDNLIDICGYISLMNYIQNDIPSDSEESFDV